MTQPELAGIPLSMTDPTSFLFGWKTEAIRFLNALDFDVELCSSQLSDKKFSALTRERLSEIKKALLWNKQVMSELLHPLLVHPLISGSKSGSLNPHRPNSHRIAENFANLFRDWAWETTEPQAQLKLIDSIFPKRALGKALILGAGCGRLAFDLASTNKFSSVTATEINPLHFLVANKLKSGEILELYEISDLPLEPSDAIHKHVLKTTLGSGKVDLVLNDFFEDTLPAEAYDIVITPWFIDVLGAPLSTTLPRINRLLKVDGFWANIGPLMFRSSMRGEVPTAKEALEIAQNFGFANKNYAQREITQLRSAHSATYRTDQVHAWLSQKTKAVAVSATSTQQESPEFLKDLKKPVRLGIDLGEAIETHQLLAAVLDLCNQQRSIEQISEALAPDFGVPKQAVAKLVAQLVGDFYRAQLGNPMLYRKK